MHVMEERERCLMELVTDTSRKVLEEAKATGMTGCELKGHAAGVVAMGSSMFDDEMGKEFIDNIVKEKVFVDAFGADSIFLRGQGYGEGN